MCKTPIRIYNRKKYVNLADFDVFMEVPCGKCVECEYQRQSEYALRAYNEYLECMQDGGFVYFDTLTYNERMLPKFLGRPCFRMSDVQRFMVNIRHALDRVYHLPKEVFRYLVVSEYGHEHKRPHYHVVFFVHTNLISVEDFHALIFQTWTKKLKYGNTDLRNAADPLAGECNGLGAIYYVTKYVTKEDDYVVEALNDTSDVLDKRFPHASKEFRKKILKRFRPFHNQSIGFGSSLIYNPLTMFGERIIEDTEQKNNVKHGFATMPCKNNPKKDMPLPLYYKRKLFYSVVYDIKDRKRCWVRNELGQDYAAEVEERILDKMTLTTYNYLTNIDNYVQLLEDDYKSEADKRGFISTLNKMVTPDDKGNYLPSIRSLFADRNVRIYCNYLRYFRGRYITSLDTADDIASDRIYNDTADVNPTVTISLNPLWSDDKFQKKIDRGYYNDNSVNQDSFPEFRDFDTIYNFLHFVKCKLSMMYTESENNIREQKRANSERKLQTLKFIE